MLVDEYNNGMGWTTASMRGGWSTPGGCRNPTVSLGGSVPSLHPTGSIRSLRSQHSMQAPPETPRRCIHCHPVHVPSTPNNYMQHPMQYYTPTHCMEGQNGTYTPHRGSSYHGDPRLRYVDDESIGGNTNWMLGDLRSLHRCVPALRRTGIDVAGMRAHFYPEGGWGWLVCAAGFLALLLTTGMQLAFGLLHLYAARHLGELHLKDIGYPRTVEYQPLDCGETRVERYVGYFNHGGPNIERAATRKGNGALARSDQFSMESACSSSARNSDTS